MEARAKLSAAASGKNHWNYGRTITKDHHDRMMAAHKRAVRVSGVVFDSLVAAAKAHGVSPETVLYRCARGVRFPDWEYV